MLESKGREWLDTTELMIDGTQMTIKGLVHWQV